MSLVEWVMDVLLLSALAATAYYAVRLERALRALRGDRAAVGELVAGFDSSARTAGAGLDRLREAAEMAGREIARHVERAAALKDDLGYLTERGNRLADRMDGLVRAQRPEAAIPASAASRFAQEDGLGAEPDRYEPPTPRTAPAAPRPDAAKAAGPLRSQAERDLLKALGVVR